jgi:hypothetical protein
MKRPPEQLPDPWLFHSDDDHFTLRQANGLETHTRPSEVIVMSASNQSMKPTAPPRNALSVFAATPCLGLSLSRYGSELNGKTRRN